MQILNKRTVGGRGNPIEYELLIVIKGVILHSGWFTLNKIVEWDECEIGRQSLKERFKFIGHKKKYKTAWEAITTPNPKKHIRKKSKQPIDKEYIDWVSSQMYRLTESQTIPL